MKNSTALYSFLTALRPRIMFAPEDESGTADTSVSDATTSDTVLGGDTVAAGDDTIVAAGDDTVAAGDDTVVLGDDTTVGDDTVKADADTGDDDKTDEEKAAEAKAAEVPEDGVYEFDIPEGVEFNEEAQKEWSEQFKDLGLTRGQAAALVAAQSAKVVAEQTAYADFISTQQKDHLATAKADKDIGGDKWDETVKIASNTLQLLRGGPKAAKNADGTDKVFKAADGSDVAGKPEGALESLILSSGNGNNPEILRELRRIGQHFSDDKFVGASTHETPVPQEQSWYGDTTPATKKG